MIMIEDHDNPAVPDDDHDTLSDEDLNEELMHIERKSRSHMNMRLSATPAWRNTTAGPLPSSRPEAIRPGLAIFVARRRRNTALSFPISATL